MKKVVILTGAGISAESGLAVFRGSNGLWGKYRVEDVATIEGWYRNPELVLQFYNERRKELLKCSPNYGHIGLAELEKYFDVRVITQNVDDLHEKAGSSNVIHLHGRLMWVRSEKNENLRFELPVDNYETHIGDKAPDGSQLRPDIVWFGEAVPMLDAAIDWVEEADIFVVIGTSLNVYPAAGLLHYVPNGVPVYLIDPNPVNDPYGKVTTYINSVASEGVKQLKEILLSDRKE
ncbi:MAG: NAD-dependent deacylase [Bacteroidaceae bacterium]|nr:NAD-dependent deacylase [Bacteroidaceae bacterium]